MSGFQWIPRTLFVTCLMAAVALAQPATLTTGYVWDSGWCAGPYIDVTAAGADVTVDNLDMYFRGTLPRDVSLYYKAGSYVGHETTPGSWTLIGTVPVIPLGDGILTPVPLGGILIPMGQTYGWKVWDNLGTGGAGGGGLILKNGGSSASNPELSLTSTMYTCNDAFMGLASGWGWQGTINYSTGTPPSVVVQSVSSPSLTVFPGEIGVDLQVNVENTGVNPLDLQTVTISFVDSLAVDRSSEYTLFPAPGQPTTIPPAGTIALVWAVDVMLSATPETITIDASVTAIDTVTMQLAADADADMPHVWVVEACAYSVCGDCDGNARVDILDALLVAQFSAGLLALPTPGSRQFNECNVLGIVFPNPAATLDILDALELARFAAGLATVSCC